MITWLNNLIQRRGKIVFIILLVVVTIAFVFTIGNTPGIVSEDERGSRTDFFGVDLNNTREVTRLETEAFISYLLQTGQPPRNEALARHLEVRVAAIALATKLGITDPSPDGLRAFIEQLPAYQRQEGGFDRERYALTLEYLKNNARITDARIADTLIGDWKMLQILDTLESVNFLHPEELSRDTLWRHSTWEVSVATLDFDSFNPEIEVTEEAIEAFHQQRLANYRTPEKTVFQYVRFSPSSALEQVDPPSEVKLLEWFQKNEEALDLEDLASLEADQAEDAATSRFTLHREAILAAYLDEAAYETAADLAQNTAEKLYLDRIALGSTEFFQLLTDRGLVLETVPPLALDEVNTSETPLARATLNQAFQMSPQRYYSDPIDEPEGPVLVFRAEVIPPSDPPLAEIRSQVEEDFRAAQTLEAFFAKGENLRASLLAGIEEGRTFEETAADLGLATQRSRPFSLSAPDFSIPFPVLQQLPRIAKDPVSPMLRNGPDGVFARVESRIGPSEADFKEFSQAIEEQLTRVPSQVFVSTLIQEWIGRSHPNLQSRGDSL
ncbi:MAG: peptidyl-prolyl cis-trans isomerase [Puniceicoccaceae bacterium]